MHRYIIYLGVIGTNGFWTMQTFTLNLSPFSTGVTDATFGRMQISTTISYQLVGTLATIEICDSSAMLSLSNWNEW